MAYLKQAKTEEELRTLTVAGVKKAYIDIATDYNKLLNYEVLYCPHCGEWKTSKAFYTNRKNASGYEHFACKECILDMCTDYDKRTKIRTDNRDKVIDTFRKLDWCYRESDYADQLSHIKEGLGERVRDTAISQLIVMVKSLPQYKDKTFKDSEFAVDDLENNTEENVKVIQKTLKSAKKRFGSGYSNEDYMFLENEYQDWVTRYECNTKAQEKIFERLAFKSWEISKATKSGQSTKDLDKTYQELLSSINILPKQNANNGLSDTLTFGQLLEKWEEHDPLPELDPELNDIDNIGKKLRVFFAGCLSRAVGLNNAYSQEFDDYMDKYTVKKPEYNGVSENANSDVYSKLFGSSTESE